jgi:two-component system, LytTR family, response regulator
MTYPDSIAIRVGERYSVLPLHQVDWIEADGNFARIHALGRARIVSRTLSLLEREVLDPAQFVRVHRRAIVNMSKIASVQPYPHGDAGIVLACGTVVPCSRRYRGRLKERIYFST